MERGKEKCTAPLPFRICFRADLYPRKYFPDLTTRARREEMDSDDLVAFDFLVGAMVVDFCGTSYELRCLRVEGPVLVSDHESAR